MMLKIILTKTEHNETRKWRRNEPNLLLSPVSIAVNQSRIG